MTLPFTCQTKTGASIAEAFDDLAKLRIRVFRDFPYLYEGSIEYEKAYLETYRKSERSFLFMIYKDRELVGATTCIPLIDETADILKAFEDTSFDLTTVFYFGESILLPEYRGLGLGHRFFDEREKHAFSFEEIKMTCFCSVERGDHPARPENYRSNEKFWEKRGYVKQPEIKTHMSWPDIGDAVESSKEMFFWTKNR